jgi:hypothetical protein
MGLFLVLVFLLTDCKDDPNSLGLDVQPPFDKIEVRSFDTTKVVAYSQFVDSVRTDETSVNLLGSLKDPVFGVSTAEIYTQFRLAATSHVFGETDEFDSLILTLDPISIYGDSSSAMTVRVYEISEQIFLDSSYYSDDSKEVYPELLCEKTFIPDLINDVVTPDDTLDPHIRLDLTSLTPSLATKLITCPADSMTTNASFQNYFYGLFVEVEPATSSGSILSIDLMSTLSEMALYYHNDTVDSLSFRYPININSARFGQFTHDYTQGDALFQSQLIDEDTTLGQNLCYIQALSGVKVFVRFPELKEYFGDTTVAINEARFFLNNAEADPPLGIARQLVMVKKKEDGSFDVLDDQLNGLDYYGGIYDEDSQGYWFRITSSIQDLVLSEDPDYGYEIILSGGAINAERVVLNGTLPTEEELIDDRMKLVVTYTAID